MRNLESLHVGGPLAIGLFIFSLIAFVTETQLTQVGFIAYPQIDLISNQLALQYVQTNLGYRQPFFLL